MHIIEHVCSLFPDFLHQLGMYTAEARVCVTSNNSPSSYINVFYAVLLLMPELTTTQPRKWNVSSQFEFNSLFRLKKGIQVNHNVSEVNN